MGRCNACGEERYDMSSSERWYCDRCGAENYPGGCVYDPEDIGERIDRYDRFFDRSR